jgi:rod shape-determining protein MreC
MRKFIAFFRRFRVFLFFVVLQLFALYFYVSTMSFPKSHYLTSSNALVGTIYSWQHELGQYLNLPETNEALQEENKTLRESNLQSLYKIEGDSIFVNDSLYAQQYTYIPGEVINSSVNKRENYFTLNIGKAQGVAQYMGVFSPKGIVGIIHSVSDHYSVVKTVLTSDINIDVVIEPIGLFGLLKWNGNSPSIGSIAGISNDLKIPKGSKVFTRGGSGIFPKGLLVGKVAGVYDLEGEALWDVEIDYSEEYRTLQRVYVIQNLFLKEQQELENNL